MSTQDDRTALDRFAHHFVSLDAPAQDFLIELAARLAPISTAIEAAQHGEFVRSMLENDAPFTGKKLDWYIERRRAEGMSEEGRLAASLLLGCVDAYSPDLMADYVLYLVRQAFSSSSE